MRQVTAQFLKNPDILHWGFEVSHLGEDEFGVWLAAPTGTQRWKGALEHSPTKYDSVFCAPKDGWWHLHYSGLGGDVYSHFVDIVTPPRWVSTDRYEMIDLDLDVAVLLDGSVVIEDEDEFEVHQKLYGYSEEMIDRALAETGRITSALKAGTEPFFEVAQGWLAEMRG